MKSLISAAIFDEFTWIRCEGKGSFRSSPTLKRFAESRVGAGERVLVIDLDGCTGMDSTFMGTLAGLAKKLTKGSGGVIQIAGADDRNRRSLEDLGLDLMVEIEPGDAAWQGRAAELRGGLKPVDDGDRALAGDAQTRHVYEAHQILSDSSDANRGKFRGVLEVLEAEMADKRNAH